MTFIVLTGIGKIKRHNLKIRWQACKNNLPVDALQRERYTPRLAR